jgi:exosortase
MVNLSTSIPSLATAVQRGFTGNHSIKAFGKRWGLPLIALATCWFLFFQELCDEWHLNPQYSYGYVVPFLGLALFWRRWPERPPITQSKSAWALVAASLILVLLPPIRVCLQANPEWRLLYWLHGAATVALSLCLLYFIGGRSWILFFAPPIAFMFIAIPWPVGLEQSIIQGLMRTTAALTVECAGWFGIPCVQHGNLIQTTVGLVGIDEACSGVRSLQSALMLSLFLGEMHRFTIRPGRKPRSNQFSCLDGRQQGPDAHGSLARRRGGPGYAHRVTWTACVSPASKARRSHGRGGSWA